MSIPTKFYITTLILIAFTTTSCSRMPTVNSAMKSTQSSLIGMKNKVVKSTPRFFKRNKPRYPAALPLRKVNNTRAKQTCPTQNTRTVVARRSIPQATPRYVQAPKPQYKTAVVNTPRITKASYTPPVQKQAAPAINPQQANQQLFNLAKSGNANQITQLINQGANANSANGSGETPLHAAASAGNIGTAQALIQRGANVNARTVRGWTPLHTAARFGRGNVAVLLLNNGAQRNTTNFDGKTPLQLARQTNQYGIVAMLQR